MSIQESIRIVPKSVTGANGNVDIAIVELDLVGEKVNKLSSPVMTRLKEVVSELAKSNYKAAILISRKPGIFVAGADIEEIKTLKSREQIIPLISEAHLIFNAIEDMKMPVIAAINGACLGGGCELALACDYRIASDDPSTKIGLPEVMLGIIPGFGGCIRLPRVIGLQAALPLILKGATFPAAKAQKLGLVDKLTTAAALEETAIRFVQELISSGKVQKRAKRYSPRGLVNTLKEKATPTRLVQLKAKKDVMKGTNGHYPAPLKAIEVVCETYGMSDRARAQKIEMEGFCQVAVTDVSKHLIDLFFLTESIKKKTGVSSGVKPHKIRRIGVLGAGTMGGGIAYVAADRGIEARMKDLNSKALQLGFDHAKALWKKQLDRKRISIFDFGKKNNLVTGSIDYAGFKELDVVIEAIVEDMKIKQKVIGETAAQCRPDCIIATNTSSLSVTEIAKGHPHPENFVGMHFFNPVDKMPLVEIIRGEKTSDEAVATVFELAKKMGKLPVVTKDGPGFVVNRLLVPYMIEAAWLLQDGMSIEKVDSLYKKQFGMPMGPFALMDEVGLDVGIKVSKIFHETLGDRIMIPPAMDKLKETGRLGKKGKKGFYLYDDRGKSQGVDQSIYSELGLPQPTNKLSDKEVIERGIFPMVNEAALALIEEHVVESPSEVDLAMIMGTGFPAFRGGLLRYADTVGTQKIADELEVYATKYGARFKPSTPLRNMAKTNRTFY